MKLPPYHPLLSITSQTKIVTSIVDTSLVHGFYRTEYTPNTHEYQVTSIHYLTTFFVSRLQDQVGQFEIIPPANCSERSFGGAD